MAKLQKSLQVQLTNADATILAASAAVTRWIRSVQAVNVTGGAVTWNFGVGATLTAALADVFGESLAANSRSNPLYFGGAGRRVDNLNLRAFASALTSINLIVVYDELDLT